MSLSGTPVAFPALLDGCCCCGLSTLGLISASQVPGAAQRGSGHLSKGRGPAAHGGESEACFRDNCRVSGPEISRPGKESSLAPWLPVTEGNRGSEGIAPSTAVLLAPRARQAPRQLSQTGRLTCETISVHDYTEPLSVNQCSELQETASFGE